MTAMTAETQDRLQHLLQDVTDAGVADKVSVADVLESIGTRSFGALLLVPCIMVLSPLSGIPGVPTTAGLIIVLVCVQYLAGRRTIWLPQRILRARISRKRLAAGFGYVQPFARSLDRVFRPRLRVLINHWTFSLVAVICAVLAATMPPLEVLPFTATITAFVIAMFAMALLYEDGLLALLALAGTIGLGAAIVFYAVPRLSEVLG
jgi:hypothetical protein